MAPYQGAMFTIAACVITALSLNFGEASEPLNWVSIEATGSYITGASGKGCHVLPDTFEVRADGTWYSASEFNLTGSMDEDCGISITLTIPLDDVSTGISGTSKPGLESTEMIVERERNASLEEYKGKLEKMKEDREERERQWKEELEKWKKYLAKKKKEEEEAANDKDRLQKEEERRQHEAKTLEEEREKLEEDRSKLENEMGTLREMQEKIKKEQEELETQKTKLNTMGSEKAAEIAKLDEYRRRLMNTLDEWGYRLTMLKKQIQWLEKRKRMLERRVKLLENETKLAEQKKALEVNKAKLHASVAEFSGTKQTSHGQVEVARNRFEKHKSEWEEKLASRQETLNARKKVLEERRLKVKSRREILKKSKTERITASAKATEEENKIKNELADLQRLRQIEIEEGEERLSNIRKLYQSCETVPGDIKIIIGTMFQVGVEQAWICSLDPDLLISNK